ncbi:MAG: hypothetical protein HYZ92_05160 [Candidatus Omnitrophica bacterium]|nr:hypothetical protein [Candidatus Omnitrophota bacterium]
MTVSLLSMVALAVTAMIAGGLRVWQRAQARGSGREAIQIAADQLRRDLRSARRFKPVGFEGEYDRLVFPAMVLGPASEEPELGRMAYFVDWAHQRLCRSQTPYPKVRQESITQRCASVLGQVRRVRFSYYDYDPGTGRGEWVGSWSSEEPPLAVKLEIGYDEQASRQLLTNTVVVPLPIAASKAAK